MAVSSACESRAGHVGAADAAQTTADAGVTLTNAQQIADAVLADSITDDKAIDLYSRAESDAYDGQQKNDAQALWSQQTNDAIAYSNSLNNLDQSTPWGAQATAQAQAQMTQAVTMAQAALTLTDGTADAQDGQEDTEWDLQQSQSDTLAQLAHDQAYADAQATFNAAQSQAAATAALAAVDGYFAALPLPLDEGGLLNNAPAPFSANYDYLNNVDDISADGTMGWSWSVGPTGEPFALQTNGVLNGATFWTLAIQAPYDPPNPYAGQPNWAPPDDPAPVPPPPDGSWNETPPPVPDVGATVYAAERQLSAKPGDAPLARQSGAATSDGTQPAASGGFWNGVKQFARDHAPSLSGIPDWVPVLGTAEKTLRDWAVGKGVDNARGVVEGAVAAGQQVVSEAGDVLEGNIGDAAASHIAFSTSYGATSPYGVSAAVSQVVPVPFVGEMVADTLGDFANELDAEAASRGKQAAPFIDTLATVLFTAATGGLGGVARGAAAAEGGIVEATLVEESIVEATLVEEAVVEGTVGQGVSVEASVIREAPTTGLTEAGGAPVPAGSNSYSATLGNAASTSYRDTFFQAHPELEGNVVVHHAIERQTLKLYPGVISEGELHSIENLRGIPKGVNSQLHLSQIRIEWNKFYLEHPTATKEQLLQKATEIDLKFGRQFQPPSGGGQ